MGVVTRQIGGIHPRACHIHLIVSRISRVDKGRQRSLILCDLGNRHEVNKIDASGPQLRHDRLIVRLPRRSRDAIKQIIAPDI